MNDRHLRNQAQNPAYNLPYIIKITLSILLPLIFILRFKAYLAPFQIRLIRQISFILISDQKIKPSKNKLESIKPNQIQIMLSTNQIRSTFLNYFKKNNHEIISSSPLIPHNDPTLMFANAGMNQFKNYFTGVETPKFKRAATSQKCVRAGGKHNDLDNVGYTARHHTFFEMLGNFSFGDYFKEEAIFYAWEFLTKELKINTEKLLVTVYHNDDEAVNFWKKIANLSDEKIIRIATDDNFWSMGEIGPCGPCSEIFYDHGEKIFGGKPGSENQDGDRFIEIWNLVFMQFEKTADAEMVPLPKPCIDTGMGLERITSVIQGKHDNYEIDLFKNITDKIENLITPTFKN